MRLSYEAIIALSEGADDAWGGAAGGPATDQRAPGAEPGARWTPPPPSRASRNVGRASKRSMRVGTVTPHGRDDFEAWGEHAAANILLADPRVEDVVGQPTAVTVVDRAGRTIRHTPDLGVRLRDGRTIGVLVRPEGRAEGINGLIDLLSTQVPADLYAGWMHLSEVPLTRELVRQADLVAWVRRDGPFPNCPEVVRMRRTVDRAMTVAEAIAASGTGSDGLRAVVRLVSDGEIRVVGHWRIHERATIEPVEARDAGAAR